MAVCQTPTRNQIPMKTLITNLLFALAFTAASLAQTASETAKAYFEVFKTGEYQKAAEFFSPQALKDFREMLDFTDLLPEEKTADFYSNIFEEDASVESVSKMTDAEFFGTFLSFVMKQAAAVGGINFDKVEILGEVPEGENTIHVLTRSRVTLGEMSLESMEVVSFEKIDGKWKALLSGKMKGMAAQIRKAFAG